MLDSALRVTNAADVSAFGHVNRVAHHAGVHPYSYSASSSETVLADIAQVPQSPSQATRLRVLYEVLPRTVVTG